MTRYDCREQVAEVRNKSKNLRVDTRYKTLEDIKFIGNSTCTFLNFITRAHDWYSILQKYMAWQKDNENKLKHTCVSYCKQNYRNNNYRNYSHCTYYFLIKRTFPSESTNFYVHFKTVFKFHRCNRIIDTIASSPC